MRVPKKLQPEDGLLLECEISCSHGGEYEVFWDVVTLKLIDVVVSIIALMMEAVRVCETPVNFDVTTRRYIPEDFSKLHVSRILHRVVSY
jgi:hypothetical protein